MKKNNKRTILICSECYSRNYTVPKQNNLEAIQRNKFCPSCNKYTIHKETR